MLVKISYTCDMDMRLAPHILRKYQHVSRLLERLDSTTDPWALAIHSSVVPCGDSIIFPGSFNPPTLAHLAMLRQAHSFAREQGGDWYIYAALSRQIVDKEAVERMTLLDRIVLLETVLKKEVKHTGILLLNRGLYVEQAQGLRAAFPQVRRLYFLLGFDKIVQILDPRYYVDRDTALSELFALAHLLVAPRGVDGEEELKKLLERPENRSFTHAIHLLPLDSRYRDMSSTRARHGELLEEIPEQARDFIWRMRPYAPPERRSDGAEVDTYAERTRALRALLA